MVSMVVHSIDTDFIFRFIKIRWWLVVVSHKTWFMMALWNVLFLMVVGGVGSSVGWV
jgi:hypothetical protein